MLTVGEIENTKKLEAALKRFEASVNKLIKLEAMKVANMERLDRGESLAYGEEAFLNLIEDE